jgi:hypothetical protein
MYSVLVSNDSNVNYEQTTEKYLGSCPSSSLQITEITLNDPPVNKVYSTNCGEYKYFSVYMSDPCKDLNITVIPLSGEPDIYVSKNDRYPTKEKLSWAAFAEGVYTLIISHWDAESSPGYYYIGVYADCSQTARNAMYYIQAREASASIEDDTDIFLNKKYSLNQKLSAKGYKVN